MRLSSTVFAAAYCRKSGPSWTTSSGYRAAPENPAGWYTVIVQSRPSAGLYPMSSVSSPCGAAGSGCVQPGVV